MSGSEASSAALTLFQLLYKLLPAPNTLHQARAQSAMNIA
jgi:hypothetical protein